MNISKWLINLNDTSVIPPDPIAIADTVESLFNFMATKGPFSIDIAELRHWEINPIHLATILRVTYIAKKSVVGWDEALQTCIKSCKHFKQNENDVLLGLI